MEINEIAKIYGTEYIQMTETLLEECKITELLPEDKNALIGIKPNLVCPTPAIYGATTHPEIVEGIIRFLRRHGYNNIVIVEGSWIGDTTMDAYEYCGFRELCERLDVPFVDCQKESSHEVNCVGLKLRICDIVDRIDFLINVPVFKGHTQTHITCALKNMKGLIPNTEKRNFHSMKLHRPIAHLNAAIHQNLIIVDHICGDLDFEEGGNPIVRNCIMVARDPVLVDTYVCRQMGYSPEDVPYLTFAETLRVGSMDTRTAHIHILGDPDYMEEPLPKAGRLLQVSYAVEEADSCSACYGNLVPALLRLKEEGLLEQLEEPISIGQGHRGKSGRIGIGQCTLGFDVNIPGCPPEEEDIYEELKKYILQSSNHMHKN